MEVQIEGGYRKPTYEDVLAYKLLVLPLSLWRYGKKRLRYHTASQQNDLSAEEKVDLCRDKIGGSRWENLTPEEQEHLVGVGGWEAGVFEEFLRLKEEDEIKKLPLAQFKRYQRYKKKNL